MGIKVESDPSKVGAEDGVVVMDGPDGVAVTLSAEAAEVTAERLLRSAQAASEQRGAGSGGADFNGESDAAR